jgi:hypothetical protein
MSLHRKRPFDVLHCHSAYPCGYLAALCKSGLQVPLVITSHGGDVRPGNCRLSKPGVFQRVALALATADSLVSISRFTRQSFLALCPNPRRIVDLPNGVDAGRFARSASRPAELDSAIAPGHYLLFLGRLHYRKGVDVLLEALAKLAPTEGVELVVAGDGDERQPLQDRAKWLGLPSRVAFVGPTAGDAKAWLLQNALATVCPSRQWEAFPLVVLESHASGTPVVATRIAGLEDVVRPGQTGWLVPPESPGELAGLLDSIRRNSEPARRMGVEARASAQAYDWQTIAGRHLDLYRELIDGHAALRRRAG